MSSPTPERLLAWRPVLDTALTTEQLNRRNLDGADDRLGSRRQRIRAINGRPSPARTIASASASPRRQPFLQDVRTAPVAGASRLLRRASGRPGPGPAFTIGRGCRSSSQLSRFARRLLHNEIVLWAPHNTIRRRHRGSSSSDPRLGVGGKSPRVPSRLWGARTTSRECEGFVQQPPRKARLEDPLRCLSRRQRRGGPAIRAKRASGPRRTSVCGGMKAGVRHEH